SLRGSALSLNAAGQSLGVFVGAALGGAGLGLAGYPGVAIVFGGLVVLALGAAVLVHRAGQADEEEAGGAPASA
ncbi:MFS transporter, partial [Streptomyces sp. NPDC006356]